MALETSGGVALLTSLPGRGQGITELVTLHLNPKLVLKSLGKKIGCLVGFIFFLSMLSLGEALKAWRFWFCLESEPRLRISPWE